MFQSEGGLSSIKWCLLCLANWGIVAQESEHVRISKDCELLGSKFNNIKKILDNFFYIF